MPLGESDTHFKTYKDEGNNTYLMQYWEIKEMIYKKHYTGPTRDTQ